MEFLSLVVASAIARSQASDNRISKPTPLRAAAIENIDDLGWVKLTDVSTTPPGTIRLACSDLEQREVAEARRIIASIRDEGAKQYLSAYADYAELVERGKGNRDYATFVATRAKALPTVYFLTAGKILAYLLDGSLELAHAAAPVWPRLEERKPDSGLAFVLYACDEVDGQVLGIFKARTAMHRYAIDHPSPVLLEYAAAMCRTASPIPTVTSGGKRIPYIGHEIKEDLPVAIELLSEVRKRYPSYERNYYELATALHDAGRRTEARQCIDAYFARFGDQAVHAARNRQLLAQLDR